jgi:hypothetical protein
VSSPGSRSPSLPLAEERKLTARRSNSSNLTVEGSAGKVSPSDSLYTALPADSRAAPAPIDPSSELAFLLALSASLTHSFPSNSRQDLLHFWTVSLFLTLLFLLSKADSSFCRSVRIYPLLPPRRAPSRELPN